MSTTMENKLVDIEESKLGNRIKFLQDRLLEASKALRSKIPEGIRDSDLTKDDFFKQWVICNTVYDSSLKDINNEGFNRMLYYMFEEVGENVPRLLNQYDIRVEMNSAGQLENIELIVLETETLDE